MELSTVKTCNACPEQWDVFDGDKRVGYMRYRYGWFEARVGGPDGASVFEAQHGSVLQGAGLPSHLYQAGLAAIAAALEKPRVYLGMTGESKTVSEVGDYFAAALEKGE